MVTHLVYFRRGTWETVEDRTEVGAALRRADHLRPPVESLYCYIARPVFAAGGRCWHILIVLFIMSVLQLFITSISTKREHRCWSWKSSWSAHLRILATVFHLRAVGRGSQRKQRDNIGLCRSREKSHRIHVYLKREKGQQNRRTERRKKSIIL